MLICPICKQQLIKLDKSLVCRNSHSFDISKSGYTNLLLSKTNAGDNKEMVDARFNFLNKGFYQKLALKLREQTVALTGTLVDAGCGTGYYSSFLNNFNIYGFDISKQAINKASKTYKQNKYFVASCNNIPLIDKSADVVLVVFAPTFMNEFYRIMKDEGILIIVSPGKNHLYELKKCLYNNPYYNHDKQPEMESFIQINHINLTYHELLNHEDLISLFKMTPYSYTTNPVDINKIPQSLNITFDFNIDIYQKKLKINRVEEK